MYVSNLQLGRHYRELIKNDDRSHKRLTAFESFFQEKNMVPIFLLHGSRTFWKIEGIDAENQY